MARYKKQRRSIVRRSKPSDDILLNRIAKLTKARKKLSAEPLNPSGGLFIRTPEQERINAIKREHQLRDYSSRIKYAKRELAAREVNRNHRNDKKPQRKWSGKSETFRGELDTARNEAIEWLNANHKQNSMSWANAKLPGGIFVSSITGSYDTTFAFLLNLEEVAQAYARFDVVGETKTVIVVNIWTPKKGKKNVGNQKRKRTPNRKRRIPKPLSRPRVRNKGIKGSTRLRKVQRKPIQKPRKRIRGSSRKPQTKRKPHPKTSHSSTRRR